MLDFVIFAVTFVIFLIIAVIYLYPGSKKSTTIPGPEPVDPLEGNIPDISACGSLFEFLIKTHEDYGPIVSFWFGPKLCVSVASPTIFEQHSAAFDRPYDLYKGLTLLTGDETIMITNGGDGRKRHAIYSKCFSQSVVEKKFLIFNKLAKEMTKRWSTWPKEEFIPVEKEMLEFSMKCLLQSDYGCLEMEDESLKTDNNKELMNAIKGNYAACWTSTERLLIGDGLQSGSPQEKRFTTSKECLEKAFNDLIKRRRNKSSTKEKLLIDVILDLEMSDSSKLSDLLTIFIIGFQKTALMLTWAIYFLAFHQDVQEKVCDEIEKYFKDEKEITSDCLSSLKYMKQVLKETMRVGLVAPYSARIQDFDTLLGGHKIPAGTPVVHSFGIVMQDKTIFPNPDRFEPDRFSDENVKSFPAFSFEPFGFSGKRCCPGSHFALAASTVLLSHLMRSVKINLAPDQIVVPQYGFMTKPTDEVWVTAFLRKKDK